MAYASNSEESEKVSELKSISGSGKLPYGTLALGTEGIKDAITGFEDAYVALQQDRSHILIYSQTEVRRRKRTATARIIRRRRSQGVSCASSKPVPPTDAVRECPCWNIRCIAIIQLPTFLGELVQYRWVTHIWFSNIPNANTIPGQTWSPGESGYNHDQSIDKKKEFGEHYFHDPGSFGREGIGTVAKRGVSADLNSLYALPYTIVSSLLFQFRYLYFAKLLVITSKVY